MIYGLNAIADDNSKILILGTFPSKITLDECKRLNRHDDYYLNFSNCKRTLQMRICNTSNANFGELLF